MADVLHVKIRQGRGSRDARRLRAAGHTPAILYGHGQECVCLDVRSDEMAAGLRHGAKIVDLQGEVSETALIRDVQWDTFGVDVLHVDFNRVAADESVDVMVSVELRGEAPGARQGGIVEHLTHEVKIECTVTSIPEKLTLSINELDVDQSLTAADIELPDGVTLVSDENAVIVQCTLPVPELEEEVPAAAETEEPEVIGKKHEEEEEEESK